MKEVIQAGARQAVVNCVRVVPEERVVIITDRQTQNLAQAIVEEIKALGADETQFVMEDFGSREGSEPLAFPAIIKETLSESQVSFYIAQCKPGELHSFRMPMIDVIQTYGLRHAHMPGFTEIMMSQGMASDYETIAELCQKVYHSVCDAQEIRVTTPAGTDLVARFNPALKWVISDGHITADNWKNLPDGEVFTAPVSADGVVVVDGCLGDHFCETYGLLATSPLRYELKDGRCIKGSVACDNAQLKRDFESYTFDTDEHSSRLGEFAIGTNIGLTGLIGNLLQDEKFPGIHLALGNPYPEKTGADWRSQAHCDGVLIKPTIRVEGETIMKEGTFCI